MSAFKKHRTRLMVLSGAAVLTVVDSTLDANTENNRYSKQCDKVIENDSDSLIINGTGIKISLAADKFTDRQTTLTITNSDKTAIVLNRVYPGVLRTSHGQFDINSIFADGPRMIKQGSTSVVSINRMH